MRFLTILLAAAIIFVPGCSSSNPTDKQGQNPNTKDKAPAEVLGAQAVFERMLSTYKDADTYLDDGQIQLSYYEHGQQRSQTARMRVAYAKPGKLALSAYQLSVACDGDRLKAWIRDKSTNNLDNQMVDRPAPNPSRRSDVVKALLSDSVMNGILLEGIGGWPAQLELLYADAPMKSLEEVKFSKSLGEEETIDDKLCYQLVVESDEERWIFWVDKQDFVLRRLRYPESSFVPDLITAPNVSTVKLVADFRHAKLNTPIRDREFKPQSGSKTDVLFFVVPPQPIGTKAIGKSVKGAYHFETLDGKRFDKSNTAGQLQLLVWFNQDPINRPFLTQLQNTVAPFRNEIALVGVCAEPREVSNETIQTLAKQWELRFPVVRDFEAFGRDIFDVKVVPSFAILDKDDVIQAFEQRANPNLAKQLPQVLQQVVGGHDLAKEILELRNQQQREYQHNLLVAQGKKSAGDSSVALREKSSPAKLRKQNSWNVELEGAANLYTFDNKILALDDKNQVTTVSFDGKLIATHRLPVSDEQITRLRATKTKDGKTTYVVWTFGGKKAYVLDNEWKKILEYPTEGEHQGINDCHIGDLDADGKLELHVGFWGITGIHQVTMDGKRQWGNRDKQNVFQLTTSPANPLGWRKLMVTGQDGLILRVNQYGNADNPESVSGRAIHHLYSSASGDESKAFYCGISLTAKGQAVGIDASLREVWRTALPAGVFGRDVEFVRHATLSDKTTYWTIGGPDGSITVVRDDGDFSDIWALGVQLRGLTAAAQGEQLLVVTSTDDSLEGTTYLPIADHRTTDAKGDVDKQNR